MGAAANIVINDGATTPVSHTFSPIGKDLKGVLWYEQTTPTPVSPLGAKRIGYRQTREFNPAGQLSGSSKLILSLHVPTLQTLGTNDQGITPPPTMAYAQTGRLECTLPERGLTQERKDFQILFGNLLLNSSAIAGAFQTLNLIY